MKQPLNQSPSGGDAGQVHYLWPSQEGTTARERFKADLQRFFRMAGATDRRSRWKVALSTEAVWAIGLYRFGQYLRTEAPRPLERALHVPYLVAHRLVQLSLGIHLFPETEIGPGLYIGHFGGVWISPKAVIGSNCNINHHVTIGSAGRGRSAPRLGDRVWVGPGAVVSGPIHVESETVIGANSLVTTNLPERALALGVPAKVIGYTGSGKLIDQAAG